MQTPDYFPRASGTAPVSRDRPTVRVVGAGGLFQAGLEALLSASGASVRSGAPLADFEDSDVRILIDHGQRDGRAFVAKDLAHAVVIGARYNRALVVQNEIRRIGGYLAVSERPGRLTEAVWDIARGGRGWLSPMIFCDSVSVLTARQTEVLCLMAAGKESQEVAAELAISLNTVRSHLRRIYESTDTKNRAEAVAWGFRQGLIR